MTIKYLKDNDLIIFEAISGSRAYGTDLPTSDTDIRGIFILPNDEILKGNTIDQVNDNTNDITYYELGKFLHLIKTNNPNILELLNTPEDCILYKHPIFDEILKHKGKYITKQCRNSFGGYAIQQIKKARGLNKKIVNPVELEKKSPLDFCYVIGGNSDKNGSVSLNAWLKSKYLKQENCGLSIIPNARDVYSLYHTLEYPYKGIVKEIDGKFVSNELRLTNIPYGELPICYISYNKDGYSKYMKDYVEYWDWVEKRNPERYENTISHGKNYDAKNLMHCHRLLDMSIEILSGKGIIVKRPNREELLAIRKGEMDYDELLSQAEDKLKEMDKLFELSDLPDSISNEFISNIILKIRNEFKTK